jgi:hypothetical protein
MISIIENSAPDGFCRGEGGMPPGAGATNGSGRV